MGNRDYKDNGEPHYGDKNYHDTGFEGYQEHSVDPGPWLLIGTTIFCVASMIVVVPLLVRLRKRKQPKVTTEELANTQSDGVFIAMTDSGHEGETIEKKKVPSTPNKGISSKTILRYDKETRKILSRAIPYTISGIGSSAFSNACLAMVGHYVGTHALSAYALVSLLVGLLDGIVSGPISACTSLCAHAVGASNNKLAGQYIQLATTFYLAANVPIMLFWWNYMAAIILWLEWGDIDTALMAQEFIRVYFWSYLLGGISSGLWQLLEVTDHVKQGTIVSLSWGLANVVVISILVATLSNPTLWHVGMAYNLSAFVSIVATFAYAHYQKWLEPFEEGLFRSNAFRNMDAVREIVKQGIPLSCGYFFSNAEWTILTIFASYLGPAEVSAWALLGSIWDMFYSCTTGIGGAAEIRAAYHFGENNPYMAQLSSYKSLFLSMSVATVVSIVFVSLHRQLPGWFTVDATLQALLEELVPFVGVANLTMQFGMTSWSLIGAQGKYKLVTWVSLVSSWGATLPVAAIFVFAFNLDLQGLTAAVVMGQVSTGAALSYVLLCTDWVKTTRKIQEKNTETAEGEAKSGDKTNGEEDKDDVAEDLYAALYPRSRAARTAARRNVRLLIVPKRRRPGIVVGEDTSRPGTYVLTVRKFSYLWRVVHPGDCILAVNGQDTSTMKPMEVAKLLASSRDSGCTITVASPNLNSEDDDYDSVVGGRPEGDGTIAKPTSLYV